MGYVVQRTLYMQLHPVFPEWRQLGIPADKIPVIHVISRKARGLDVEDGKAYTWISVPTPI
jgi:hypothetical protein